MHIVFIVPGGVDRSGRERVIPALLALIERLARRHQLTVIALEQEATPCSYELCGARVFCLGQDERRAARMPGVQLLRRFGRLAALLTQRVDVVHAFWFGEASTLGLLAGRRFGAPLLASLGGGEMVWLPQLAYGGQGDWRGRLHTALALRFADALTAGSRYALAPLTRRGAAARWLPLGADYTRFAAPVARPDGPPWRLLHVASINRVKDQATLLRALQIVHKELAENANQATIHKLQATIALDWVGVDTLGGQMQTYCRELGLEHSVRFHHFLPNDALAALYRGAHLHLLSSQHESQCVAVCEAAAAGVPTVGTAVGLLPELAPAAAWAVPVGDAAALAAVILALLHDGARRERMGRAAQAWAQIHDADWTARQFEEVYEGIVDCRL